MRATKLWARLAGVHKVAVVESVSWEELDGTDLFDEEATSFEWSRPGIVLSVRPYFRDRQRCGRCGRQARWYDRGDGRRRWRTLDLGTTFCYLEADAPRVNCPVHGPTVIWVPWARHDARFTRTFDDLAAWLATHTSKAAVEELLRVTWRTVGRIVTRVSAEAQAARDRFADLRRIGVDEVSFKRRHRYLTVIVDHDTGELVWAAEGASQKVLGRFFDELGADRCGQIELVSADGAEWAHTVIRTRCGTATICLDPFHVISWMTKALDEVRRDIWNDIRRSGKSAAAREIKGTRFLLWRNNEDLDDDQHVRLATIARVNDRLWRAYLIKEQLRNVYRGDPDLAGFRLDRWLGWALRCRIPAVVKVARTIQAHRAEILAAIRHGVTQGRVEGNNNRIRLIVRRGFGFRHADAVIALAMLTTGGLCPPLPGRT